MQKGRWGTIHPGPRVIHQEAPGSSKGQPRRCSRRQSLVHQMLNAPPGMDYLARVRVCLCVCLGGICERQRKRAKYDMWIFDRSYVGIRLWGRDPHVFMSLWVLKNNNGNLGVLKVDVKNLEETESNSWMLMCIKKMRQGDAGAQALCESNALVLVKQNRCILYSTKSPPGHPNKSQNQKALSQLKDRAFSVQIKINCNISLFIRPVCTAA